MALWFENVAKENGLETEVINIDRFEKIDKPNITKNTLIGFFSPTHGFNLPPIMLKFIWQFPKLKNTDTFIINTRAGMKLHKWFLPGLSGIAQIFPATVLKLKGFNIVGMQPMDLPSNWLLVHPGVKMKVIDSMFERYQKITKQFASDLLEGKKKYKALLSLPIDLLVLPIAILYFVVGRFFLAKTLIASYDCNQCMSCVNQCPVKAISMVDNRPYWSYNCESCMRCANICSQRAIETTQSFSIFLLVFSSLVISPLSIAILKLFGIWDLINQSAIAQNIWAIIDAAIFLSFVFISYRILHYLMRYKTFNNIISYTFLSSYKFWRRYRAPKNNLN